jgi:hypothetical protein
MLPSDTAVHWILIGGQWKIAHRVYVMKQASNGVFGSNFPYGDSLYMDDSINTWELVDQAEVDISNTWLP